VPVIPPSQIVESNFRGKVPIQSLISIELSLKWAIDESSQWKGETDQNDLFNHIL